MDAEKIYSLLFNLYAEQENIKIEYELDNSFFSTGCFNQKHSCCLGTVCLRSREVRSSLSFLPIDLLLIIIFTPPKNVYISMISYGCYLKQ